MRVCILAVCDIRGIIAVNRFDSIDWSSKEDKNFFKDITTKSGVIVMGRKTFESIGRKLPNRFNVVLSRTYNTYDFYGKNRFLEPPDLVLSGQANEILFALRDYGYEDICIIGGQSVFTEFINSGFVTDVYITFEPFILPGSINLFSSEITNKIELKLENITKLNEKGTINIHYTLK